MLRADTGSAPEVVPFGSGRVGGQCVTEFQGFCSDIYAKSSILVSFLIEKHREC